MQLFSITAESWQRRRANSTYTTTSCFRYFTNCNLSTYYTCAHGFLIRWRSEADCEAVRTCRGRADAKQTRPLRLLQRRQWPALLSLLFLLLCREQLETKRHATPRHGTQRRIIMHTRCSCKNMPNAYRSWHYIMQFYGLSSIHKLYGVVFSRRAGRVLLLNR